MNTQTCLNRSLSGLAALAVFLALAPRGFATAGSWNADAADNWSNAARWTGGIPTAAGDTANLTFNITAARTITIDTTSRIVGTLNIGDPTSSYFGYTLAASGGAGLTFNNSGNGAQLNKTAAANSVVDTISAPIALAENLTINNTDTTSGSGLTISGIVSGTGFGITNSGAGTLTLSGANTFTGDVNANAGTLTSAAATTATASFLGAVGSSGTHRTVNIASGATVSYTSTAANSFQNLGGTPASGGYGSFYDFNITGTLAINDGAAVSQILQSTYNLSNGGIITNTGSAHTGAYGLLFGWSGAGGGNINVTGTGNQITADRIGFFNGATITTAAGANLTIASIIKNGNTTPTALNKTGAGRLTLSGANTYTGATTVSNGTLVVNGSLAGGGAVIVQSGATLGGSGVVAGFTTNYGTIAPGIVSAGTTLTVSGSLDSSVGGSVNLGLSTSFSSGNDQVSVGGTLKAAGSIKLTALSGAANLDTTSDYILMSCASVSGTFSVSPVWVGTPPANAAHFLIQNSGANVVLHYWPVIPPIVTASANPSGPTRQYQNVTVTAVVTPGDGAVTSVTADFSPLGGSPTTSLVLSNANVYTNSITITPSIPLGPVTLLVTATDANSLTGTYSVTVTVQPTPEVWGGAGADNNWGTAANWTNNVSPITGDNVFFAGATRLSPNLETSYNIGSVTFNPSAAAFVLGTANGSTLTLAGSVTNNSANPQTINVPLNFSAPTTFNTDSNNLVIGGDLSDSAAGLIKTGSNTLTLTGINASFSGGTVIGANGTLEIGGGGQLAAGNYLGAIANNGTLLHSSSADQTLQGVISGSGGVTKTNSSTLFLTGANTYAGTTTVSGGILQAGIASNNGLPANGNVAIASGATFIFSAAAGGVNYGGQLSGSGTFKVPAGSRVNTGLETNSGSLSWIVDGAIAATASSAHLTIGSLSGTNAGASIGEGGSNTGRMLTIGGLNVDSTFAGQLIADVKVFKIGTGNLVLTATNSYSGYTTISNGTVTIGGAGLLGSGAYAALITNYAALAYSSSAAQTLSGVISGTGSLTNNGPGTLTLSASNTYSGPTILNGGTTVGVTAGNCGFSPVTVANSAATLSISITNNTRNWSCTNLTIAAAGTLDFNFGAITPATNGGVAPLVVSNAVAFTATPVVTVSGNVFGTLPIGSYPLMTWSSASGTVPTAVTLPPHRGTANLSVSGNTLYLNITSLGTQPLSWAAGSGNWDINLTSNWKDSVNTTTKFLNQDSVVFEDTISGAGPITVTLVTNVVPTAVTVTNNSKAYTLAGTGAITGAVGLTKAGANSLVLINTNTYTGATVVQGGTLQLGDGVANNGVVAGGIAMSNGVTLAFATPNDQTNSGVISGTGAVTKSGAGMLTLTVSNTYSGDTAISAGALRLLRPGLINSSTPTVNPGGTLVLDGNNNIWTSGNPTNRILLNGGTLGMYAAGFQGKYITVSGAVSNLPAASSTISMAVVGGGNAPPNPSDLFMDGGLTGSGTVTISNNVSANGMGVCLRTPNTSFSGTLIVIGNPTTTISAASGLAVGYSGGQPTLTNADLEVDGTLEMGGSASGFGWGSGTVNGQTLAIGALNGTGLVIANMTAASTRGLSIGGNNHSGVFSGQIYDGANSTLSLTKAGTGTQALTGGNTYTGATTVNGGTLQVNNPGSLASPVTVASGGTLGGNGTLTGTVTVQGGGTLTVGTNSTLAMLLINNTLTFAANSTNVMRISKNGGVAANDQIAGLSSVTYGGTLRVVNTTTDASPLVLGDTFTLYPTTGSTAYNLGFGNVMLPALPAGLSWNLNSLTVDGSISVTNQVSTPLFSPGGGGYAGAQSVTITCATTGATIHYTTDGSTPTISSPVYTSPIAVPAPTNSMTIKAYAIKAGSGDSAVGSANYATVVTPTWLNASGGSWSDTSSWSNTVVANGVGVTADFSTLTLSFDPTVSLNTPATVGALKFADQGNAFSWTLADGGAGPLTLDNGVSQPAITVNTNTTISAALAGANGFIKAGAGTLILSGANAYTGNTLINAGVGEVKFTATPPNTTFVGSGTVEFNYPGNVGVAATFGSGFTGQLLVTGTILNSGSSFANNLGDVALDGSSSCFINGQTVQADELTGSGPMNNTGVFSPAPATLTLGVNNGNGSNAVFSGSMTSSSTDNGRISIIKKGTGSQTLSGNLSTGSGTVTVNAGTLTLSGTDTYTGATTVSNGTLRVNGSLAAGSVVTVVGGTLGGVGTINGAVTVQAGATLSAGTNGVGTLTLNSNLTLVGNLLMEVDKTLSPSNDVINVTRAITNLGTGTLTVMNLNNGAPLALGDKFYPFGGSNVVGGASLAIAPAPGAGLAWQNHLAVDGSIAVVSTVNTSSTNLTFTVSGGTLHLSWPADHLGWHLQAQTNSLTSGLGTNWVTIPGSDTVTSMNITMDPTKPTVFFRMIYP